MLLSTCCISQALYKCTIPFELPQSLWSREHCFHFTNGERAWERTLGPTRYLPRLLHEECAWVSLWWWCRPRQVVFPSLLKWSAWPCCKVLANFTVAVRRAWVGLPRKLVQRRRFSLVLAFSMWSFPSLLEFGSGAAILWWPGDQHEDRSHEEAFVTGEE